MAITSSQSPEAAKPQLPNDVESAKCASCGFTEDCTYAYMSKIRERFNGRWICGLCIEAVKDERIRSEGRITTEEALNRHISFCKKFRSLSFDETEHPIFVMGRVLRRSLDTPRRTGSCHDLGGGPQLVRSVSCFPALSGTLDDVVRSS